MDKIRLNISYNNKCYHDFPGPTKRKFAYEDKPFFTGKLRGTQRENSPRATFI